MRIVYLYTTFNWYRMELFKSISKLADIHVYILNGYSLGYDEIAYSPDTSSVNITVLSKDESKYSTLVDILNKEDFDAVVVPSMNSVYTIGLTTRLTHYFKRRNKCVMYFWEYWPMEFGRYGISKIIKQNVRDLFTRINKRSIDYFITPSINTYSFYTKLGIPRRKIVRCYNSSVVNVGSQSRSIRQELGISESDKVVLYFGRIEKYKGYNELLMAFNKLSHEDCHLLLCGPGADNASLQRTYKNNTHIHFVGSVNPEDRYFYYRAADVFVLPNNYAKKIEAWGLTINEAMQFALPIIATDATGSAVDLVFNGVNGYIVDSRNLVSELVFYMEKLLSDSGRIENMGRASEEIIKAYTFDNMAEAFVVAAEKYLISRQEISHTSMI